MAVRAGNGKGQGGVLRPGGRHGSSGWYGKLSLQNITSFKKVSP